MFLIFIINKYYQQLMMFSYTAPWNPGPLWWTTPESSIHISHSMNVPPERGNRQPWLKASPEQTWRTAIEGSGMEEQCTGMQREEKSMWARITGEFCSFSLLRTVGFCCVEEHSRTFCMCENFRRLAELKLLLKSCMWDRYR